MVAARGSEAPRVVITGLGVATALGVELEPFWRQVIDGRSGIAPIRQFDSRPFPVSIGAEVDLDALPVDGADPEERDNRTLRFALWAAKNAWRQAGFDGGLATPRRGGVVVGGGVFPVVEEIIEGCDDSLLDGDRIDCQRYLDIYTRRPELLAQQDLMAVSSRLSAAFGLG
ncbi:MAG: beta-ketoacyl synthase N-terminal-like domain-containing protein, partial [Acidobacteriota bacterium]